MLSHPIKDTLSSSQNLGTQEDLEDKFNPVLIQYSEHVNEKFPDQQSCAYFADNSAYISFIVGFFFFFNTKECPQKQDLCFPESSLPTGWQTESESLRSLP